MKSKLLLTVCAVTLAAAAALGQTSRGTVSGTVTDINGAVVPGATVTLTSAGTNVSRTTVTNEEGLYRFDAVDLGSYTVTIGATGFGQVEKTNVVVNANQTSTVDAQLQPGGQQVTIDVVAEAGAALQTESPVRGGNISETQIRELPIATRNPVSLALTLPGVSSNRAGFGVGTFSVNGARGRSNNFLIDGIENNDISVAGQGFQVTNTDAVQEVSVQTGNFDSEFGRAGGAVVNVITKGGGSQYHGTAAYILDSTVDDAITSSQARDPETVLRGRPPSGTEQWFSGTLGGPIFKDRTFFFGAFQELRRNSTDQVALTIPTAAGRATLRSLFPAGTNPRVDTYLALTEGFVGVSDISTQALGLGRPAVEFGTFNRSYPALFRDRQIQARIDHKLGENDQLMGRYLYDDIVEPAGGDVSLPGFEAANNNRYHNFLLTETHVFSPSLTNELRLGYSRLQLDFPITGDNPLARTLPAFRITNLNSSSGNALGVATNIPQGRVANNYVIQDTMTYLRGNHTFRFGGEFVRQISRQSAPFNARGLLDYRSGGGFTAFANFVDDFGGSGPPTGTVTIDFGSPVYFPSLHRTSVFAQDRWKASESLTLTLGLRYEYFGTPFNTLRTPAYTGLFNVDPETRTGPFAEPNQVSRDLNNFAPTLGFAYSPSFTGGFLGRVLGDRVTVLRGGYQIGYDSFFNNIASNAASSSPNVIATSVVSQLSAANPRGLANVSQSLPTTARPLSPLDAQTLIDPNLRNPYYQRWSLGVQRELPGRFILDMAYVGSKGTNLYVNEDRNPLVPAALRSAIPAGYPNCTPGTNVTAAQATARFAAGTPCPLSGRLDNLQGGRTVRSNSGDSNYHSGQFSLTRRFADNYTFTANYTWSKLIDNQSEVFASAGVTNSSLPIIPHVLGGERRDRAVSLFDRPHRATFTYVYAVPFFRDQRGALGRLLGGFELAGVTTFESGVPFTVTNGIDADGIGGNNDRPDFNPAGAAGVRAVPNAASPTGFVNPDAGNAPIDPLTARYIVLPAGSGRTGNLGRNTERSPGFNNWNLTLSKRTRLTEGTSLEFRTEFFNLFNHPQFGVSNASPFTQFTNGNPLGGTAIPAVAGTALAGTFLNPDTQFSDGGGRVIRYQLKFVF